MKIKLFLFAALLVLVFCFTSINSYSAPSSNDTPQITYFSDGTYEIRVLADGFWIITTYAPDGGLIRVITQPVG